MKINMKKHLSEWSNHIDLIFGARMEHIGAINSVPGFP